MLMLLLIGSSDFSLGNPWGILLAVLTVSMSVSYSVVLRRIPTRYSSLSIVFYVQSFALLLFIPLWGVVDGKEVVANMSEVLYSGEQLLSSWLSVGYLAVFASVSAFVLFCYTVREIGVTRANVFNNVRPVFTALLVWILMDEVLPFWKLVGVLLIIVGLFISQRQCRK
jgi:drug/metabolite transporter (DMT)-like permease